MRIRNPYSDRYEQFYEDASNDPDVIDYISNISRPDLLALSIREGIDIQDVEGWEEALDNYCEQEYYKIYNGR